MVQQQIGRYRLIKKLGQGGMATVYQAYDEHFQREVAVKTLQSGGLEDDLTQTKFAQEARIIASVEHHAIVPVYDFGEHDGQLYLVMRLMTGGSLKEQLALASPSLPQTTDILGRICSALDKAHANHIVHRDIKPANILFDEEGLAYLADFGIARLTDHTQTMTIIGSPRYMAPEQAQGRPLSAQTDVYQMGIVLFHMLSGQVPFDGETTDAILYQHVHSPIPTLTQLNPTLPVGCDAVIQRALAKDPAQRYASAGALAQQFRTVTGQAPIALSTNQPPTQPISTPEPSNALTMTAAPVSEPTIVAPPTEQRPRRLPPLWSLALAGVVGILLLCVAGGWLVNRWLFGGDPNPAPIVSVPTRTGTVQPTQPADAPVVAPTVTLPSDAPSAEIFDLTAEALQALGGGTGRLAYAAERNDNFDIFITEAEGTERRLTHYIGGDFRPIWSPTGERLAYHSLDDTWDIYVMDADGSNARNVTNHPADDSFPQWSPDGTRLLFHSNRDPIAGRAQFDIYVMDADGSNVLRLTNDSQNETGASWSPDGQQIVFQRQAANGREQLFIRQSDGSNERLLTSSDYSAIVPVWSPDGAYIAYHSNREGFWGIDIIHPDGSAVRRLTSEAHPSYYPSWSPNGQWILYHRNMGNNNRDLWMVNVETGEERRLTNTAEQERMVNWQP